MPLGWTTPLRSAASGRVLAGAWFLDLFCVTPVTGEAATLRCWNQLEDFDFDDGAGGTATYEGLGERFTPPSDITSQIGSAAESLSFVFDASGILDNDTFMGRFADRWWSQRQILARHVLFDADSNFSYPVGVDLQWIGIMDRAPFTQGAGAQQTRELICETGAIRLRTANPQYRTDQNHRRYAPTDPFYRRTPIAINETLPFNAEMSAAPGAAVRGR